MPHRSLFLALLGLTLWLALCHSASAQRWAVIVNGKAIHLNASRSWNEANWGLGVEREFDSQAHWVKVALANGFVDSNNEMSYMAGGGILRRLEWGRSRLHIDLGAVGFFMTRANIRKDRPFPGLLPALAIGSRYFSVNMTYLPMSIIENVTHVHLFDPTVSSVLFLQVKLSPRLLGASSIARRGRR